MTISEQTRELVNRLGDEAEASRDLPVPDGARPIRRGRSSVLSVRLGDDEIEQLTTRADEAGIPVSTMARSLIVRAMGGELPTSASLHEEIVAAMRQVLHEDDIGA